MFEASRLQHNIVSGFIQIVSDGHYLPAFWAHPDLGGSFPGLVLLHDHWGLTPHIRVQARRFAERGYYVVTPDLFNRQTATSPTQAQALIEQVGEAVHSHVAAALHALKSHHKCDGKIGLIGWGMGGRLALQTAIVRDDLRALVAFYGLSEAITPAELLTLACPALIVLGEADADVSAATVARCRDVLAQAGMAHEIVTYPEVGRDFFDDSRPAFRPEAAEDAWKRALAFLSEQLDLPQPPEPDEFDPGRVY